jgi:hypothetical protein
VVRSRPNRVLVDSVTPPSLHNLFCVHSAYSVPHREGEGSRERAERESSFEDNAIRRGVPVGRETTLPPSAKPPEERTWPQVTMLSFSAPDYTTSNYGDPLHTTHTIRMESRDQRPPNMTCTIRTLYIHVCVCGYARLPKAYVVHTHTTPRHWSSRQVHTVHQTPSKPEPTTHSGDFRECYITGA